MDARCHCGAVRFKTPLAAPLATYVCHCDTCKSLSSSAFAMSAIFPKFELPPSELLSCYTCVCAPFLAVRKKKKPLLVCAHTWVDD